RSSGGRSSKAMPGRTQRRGPAKRTGEARSLHIGSVSTLSGPNCSSVLACPTHVTVRMPSLARGARKAGDATGKLEGDGSAGRRVRARRPIHFSTEPRPATVLPGHGFEYRRATRLNIHAPFGPIQTLGPTAGTGRGPRLHGLLMDP